MTATKDDIPMPARAKVEAALATIDDDRTTADWNEIEEAARWALHVTPPELDFTYLTPQNPLNQVYFRAGLLACREYMARFVEQGGNPEIAQSIRANWWPRLGADPGAPRLFDFSELCTESEGHDGKPKWTSKEVSTNVEALPHAHQFLNPGPEE